MSAIVDLWYLTPVCVLGATLATTVGVGGPVFLTPLFVLVLELPPATAVATALFTQLFGFLSASVAYRQRGLINFEVARGLLIVAAPAALLGSLIAPLVPGLLIRRVFGVIALLVAYRVAVWKAAPIHPRTVHRDGADRRVEGTLLAGAGGLLAGMTSIGLAETQGYHLIVRRGMAAHMAVATTIFVVAVTVAAGSVGHLVRLTADADVEQLPRVLTILAFTVPGVLIGGQLGPIAQARLSATGTTRAIAVILVGVGVTMIALS